MMGFQGVTMRRTFAAVVIGAAMVCGATPNAGWTQTAGDQTAMNQTAAAQDPAFTRINLLVQQNPAAALIEIDLALTALATGPDPDPRAIHDLNRLAADLLITEGRAAEAAVLLEQLAQFTARFRDRLQIDPVPLWRAAATQYTLARDPAGALRMQTAILQDQRDAGLPDEVLAETLALMADLAEQAGLTTEAPPDSAPPDSSPPVADPVPEPPVTGTRGAGEGFSRIEVFYATDRARSGDPYPGEFYGFARGPLDYGVLEVTIPDSHVPGAIEAPSIWRLEFGPSAARHMTLRSVEPLAHRAFFDRMHDRMATRARKEAFVFIHGYNVSFDAAAKRAAQLAHDMNYVGVPVLYSWPSRGSTVGYMADSAVVQLSARHLSLFLDDLVAQSGAETIHIVAHSMGNRALTEALELMALRRGQTGRMPPPFDQIVFAAPDVDAGLFAAMLPTIRPLARRLTLYASENDWALATSRKLHGDAPRAGQGGVDTLAAPMLDSVDMSELGEDMLAHGYFADDSSALVDLVALFWQNLPPERRCGLLPGQGAGGASVWRYARDSCPDNTLLAVIASLQDQGISTASEANRALSRMVPDPAMRLSIGPAVMRMFAP